MKGSRLLSRTRISVSGVNQASKVCIALESVFMSILHTSVMVSLAATHADADGAVYRQAQEHHVDGCQVGTFHVCTHERNCFTIEGRILA